MPYHLTTDDLEDLIDLVNETIITCQGDQDVKPYIEMRRKLHWELHDLLPLPLIRVGDTQAGEEITVSLDLDHLPTFYIDGLPVDPADIPAVNR